MRIANSANKNAPKMLLGKTMAQSRIVGGVFIVTLLEYGQVKGGEEEGQGFRR